jgi:hypothetical protein
VSRSSRRCSTVPIPRLLDESRSAQLVVIDDRGLGAAGPARCPAGGTRPALHRDVELGTDHGRACRRRSPHLRWYGDSHETMVLPSADGRIESSDHEPQVSVDVLRSQVLRPGGSGRVTGAGRRLRGAP